MTKLDAIKEALGRLRIGTKVLEADYDPAGSTIEYDVSDHDRELLEAIVGRSISDSDLWFNVGAGSPSCYAVTKNLLSDITL